MAKETVTNRRCTDEFKVEALRLAESFGQLPQAGPNSDPAASFLGPGRRGQGKRRLWPSSVSFRA